MLPGKQATEKIIEWIDNIIGVPSKEIGLLITDNVKRWRVNNQLNTLSKAIEKANRLNLPTKKIISPKLICPLLENCSLEEDDYMQDKWANMLVNMLDSDKNVQNHVFPFILSQLSKQEFEAIDSFYNEMSTELSKSIEKLTIANNLHTDCQNKKNQLSQIFAPGTAEWYNETNHIERELISLNIEIKTLTSKIEELICIPIDTLEAFELENLCRLGLIKAIPKNEASAFLSRKRFVNVNIATIGFDYQLTDLGEMFIFACNENDIEESK